jgi:hypothetical protein
LSDEKRAIKVNDKRMFTPDGELREEYRFLQEKSTQEEPAPPAAETLDPVAGPAAAALPETPAPGSPGEPMHPAEAEDGDDWLHDADGPALELPGAPPGMARASFFDLIGMLAEPIAIYLGDEPLQDGESAENLEMARIHIDLLDVVRQKTRGNLSAQEASVLEDILYRSRMRYVQKGG